MATEKRLIDANAFEFSPDENCIANGVLIWGNRTGGKTMTTVLAALKKMVDNAPTVDAVPVVRCKDCKYSKLDDVIYRKTADGETNDTTLYCCFYHWDRNERNNGDHFCSHGERKSDGC